MKLSKNSKSSGAITKSKGSKITKSQSGKVSKSSRNGSGSTLKIQPVSMSEQVFGSNPQAKAMIDALFARFGVEYPELNGADPQLTEKVVALKKVAAIAQKNIAAVKEMFGIAQKFANFEATKAEAEAAIGRVVIDGKKRIDKATAALFLDVYAYNKGVNHLEQKVNRRVQAVDAQFDSLAALGDGQLQSSLAWIQNKEQMGAERISNTNEARQERVNLLKGHAAQRRKEKEYLRYGHLNSVQ